MHIIKDPNTISWNFLYPHNIPIFTSMERRKARTGSNTDGLALVKAAAWAWYQHGSGSEQRSICEYDVTMSKKAPKPSRYKLEAIREERFISSPIHLPSDNSLLDVYEIERISTQLDRYIESSHDKYYGNYSERIKDDRVEVEMKKRKKKSRGFWSRHAVICGSRSSDVVGGISSGGSGCLPKHVPVVHVSHCRPWSAYAK